ADPDSMILDGECGPPALGCARPNACHRMRLERRRAGCLFHSDRCSTTRCRVCRGLGRRRMDRRDLVCAAQVTGVRCAAACVWAGVRAAAVASPLPIPTPATHRLPSTVCTISDSGGGGAVHITGLAALPAGGYVVTTAGRQNDFTPHLDYMDGSCRGVGFD